MIHESRLCPVTVVMILVLSGCMVGPNFLRPKVVISPTWLEAGDPRVKNESADYRNWWQAFNDPALDRLIDRAYRENLSLKKAGARVLEARAQLGISVGRLYPQTQQTSGFLQYNRTSERSPQLRSSSLRSARVARSLRRAVFSNTGRTKSG